MPPTYADLLTLAAAAPPITVAGATTPYGQAHIARIRRKEWPELLPQTEEFPNSAAFGEDADAGNAPRAATPAPTTDFSTDFDPATGQLLSSATAATTAALLSDSELDAHADRGEFPQDSAEAIANEDHYTVTLPDELPLLATMRDITNRLRTRFRGWPRKCDGTLFICNNGNGRNGHPHNKHQPCGSGGGTNIGTSPSPSVLPSVPTPPVRICRLKSPPDLFGWLSTFGTVDWSRRQGAVSKEEFFHEWRRTAYSYAAIENFPHEPPVSNHFYACPASASTPGDGTALARLLDFFSLETEPDRHLLTAALATPLWGGEPGTRPAFMFTAKQGRGKGKTKCAETLARLYGGAIDISPREDITAIKKRFLTPDARTQRVALLDNVKTTKFSWGELEGLITAATVSGWEVYVGEAKRPNYITWLITLNGASLSTDMAQRVVEIRLDEPIYTATWEDEIRTFTTTHHHAILGDLVAFLRRPVTAPITRHARWASWESAVLARTDLPNECHKLILDRRGEVDADTEESAVISDYFASKLTWLGYNIDRDDVFIPSEFVAKWYNRATGENRKTVAITRTLKQLRDEGKIWRLVHYRSQDERGFRWVGEHAEQSELIQFDLRKKFSAKIAEQKEGPDGWWQK